MPPRGARDVLIPFAAAAFDSDSHCSTLRVGILPFFFFREVSCIRCRFERFFTRYMYVYMRRRWQLTLLEVGECSFA